MEDEERGVEVGQGVAVGGEGVEGEILGIIKYCFEEYRATGVTGDVLIHEKEITG